MFDALAAMLGLEQLRLGVQGAQAPLTGLWTLELNAPHEPAVVVAVVHQDVRCRAALAVMPEDPFSPLPSHCMNGDAVVRAAEKQLRYVPLMVAASSRAPSTHSIHYRVQCWAEDSSSSVAFVTPSSGPLRTLSTTLHQLVNHVARATGAHDSVRFLSGDPCDDEMAAE